jgi:Reverse transcriptase (RNA-dependent DNA polymerase).
VDVNYTRKYMNSLYSFGTMKNCHKNGNNSLLFILIRKVLELTNNYRGISLLSTSHKILSNIIVSRMTPYVNEIIGEYQCGFRRNRSTDDHIFSIRQILEKKWEYNKDVCQLLTDFEKAYDSTKRESLYDILIKFGVRKKLVRLIKTCLDGTQRKVRIGNYLSSSFPIENSLKQGDALSQQLFNFSLEYAIRKVQETNLGLCMNGIYQVLVYADDVNLIGDDI